MLAGTTLAAVECGVIATMVTAVNALTGKEGLVIDQNFIHQALATTGQIIKDASFPFFILAWSQARLITRRVLSGQRR